MSKYYGVLTAANEPGFITRDGMDGMFRVKAVREMTQGNGWSSFDNVALKGVSGLLEKLKQYHFTIQEFDSPKQLFAWLAERA